MLIDYNYFTALCYCRSQEINKFWNFGCVVDIGPSEEPANYGKPFGTSEYVLFFYKEWVTKRNENAPVFTFDFDSFGKKY